MNLTAENPERLLAAEALSCERSGRLLFSKLSFVLEAGQRLHLLGENGSGKTTLLRALAGLFSGYSGRVLRRPDFWQNCIYLGHAPGITGAMTASENLNYAVQLNSGERPAKEAVLQALARAGLADFARLPVRNLSAGQQKRVSLLPLMLTRAELWVLDEPFSAMDGEGSQLLESLLCEQQSRGGAVILTGHNLQPEAASATLDLAGYC